MVLLEPPAPAERVLLGRALAIFSFWSAAARRRMAVRGPPGGVGDEGRLRLAPVAAPSGEEARGEDYWQDRDVSVKTFQFFICTISQETSRIFKGCAITRRDVLPLFSVS